MAKKKKNLQNLIKKRQQLQQITQSDILPEKITSPISADVKDLKDSIKSVDSELPQIAQDKITIPGIRRTLFSVAIIAIILVSVVVFNQKSPVLTNFGSWLYGTLKLGSSS